MLVDSSVWIDHYAGRHSAVCGVLREALASGRPIFVTDIIVVEVLQGFRSDGDFDTAAGQLPKFPRLALDDKGHLAAARLSRQLRAKGVNFGSVIDILIAQIALTHNQPLLTGDAGFKRIAEHTNLRLLVQPA